MRQALLTTCTFLAVFLFIPHSDTADASESGNVSARELLQFDQGTAPGTLEKNANFLHLIDDKKETGYSYSLSGEKKEQTPEALQPDSRDIFNIPPSLVNGITYDFSYRSSARQNSGSFIELPSSFRDALFMGAAFFTNLAVHEFGHEVVANHVGAEGSELDFFQKEGGDFFLGTSSVDKIDARSNLSYTMGGEFFADLTFEHALRAYRKNPNTFNKSLLVSSGTDFLWYCFYTFYIVDDNSSYDPITVTHETGMSRDMLFSAVLAKTLVNAYRVYSGQDRVVPYFTVDRYSARVHLMIPFDMAGWDEQDLLPFLASGKGASNRHDIVSGRDYIPPDEH